MRSIAESTTYNFSPPETPPSLKMRILRPTNIRTRATQLPHPVYMLSKGMDVLVAANATLPTRAPIPVTVVLRSVYAQAEPATRRIRSLAKQWS